MTQTSLAIICTDTQKNLCVLQIVKKQKHVSLDVHTSTHTHTHTHTHPHVCTHACTHTLLQHSSWPIRTEKPKWLHMLNKMIRIGEDQQHLHAII